MKILVKYAFLSVWLWPAIRPHPQSDMCAFTPHPYAAALMAMIDAALSFIA